MFFIALFLSLFIQINCIAEQIITLFVHGVADSHAQALQFTKKSDRPYIVEDIISFDLDCAKTPYLRINHPYCSLGQHNELEQINKQWLTINEQYPYADGFILIGVSRGASAIINFLALYKPQKVKAVILDSPFDTIETLIPHRAKRYGVWPSVIRMAIPYIFWQFNPKGPFPLNVIDQIEEDIPMLFVTVEADHSVPLISSQNLINARINAGHKKVHHVHLAQGKHGKLMLGPDAVMYQNAAHAFFAHYQLPHNCSFAAQGDTLLMQYMSTALIAS